MGFLSSLVGGTIGKIVGNSVDSHYQRENTRFNIEQQKEFSKYINSNKHQWEIEDLRKAGLNPILSATNSSYSSASFPVGSSGSSVNPEVAANRKIDEVEKRQLDLNGKIAMADIANKNSSTALNDSQREINKLMSDKSIELMNAQILNAFKNGLFIDSQTAKNYQDVLIGRAQVDNINAVTAKNLLDSEAKEIKNEEIKRASSRSGTIFDSVDDAIRRFRFNWSFGG